MQNKLLLRIVVVSLAAGLLLGGCAPATTPANLAAPASATPLPSPEPISLSDGLGKTVTLASPAQRVVSLAPANTEILYAIGAGSQVVGRDTFSDYPSEAQAVTDIGGSFAELNTELILSLDPDLVLASALSPPEQIKGLEDLGLMVYAVPNPTDFEGMYRNLQALASLTGHTAEAEALIEKLRSRVDAVEAKLAAVTERPLVFYELDGTDPNAPWTAGPGTFVSTLIDMAGGRNLGNSLASEWAQISVEELIAQNPDIILIGDATWGGVTVEDVKARSGWGTLGAIQNNSLFTFDDNLVSRPGPRLVDGLEAMARLLHPDLFE